MGTFTWPLRISSIDGEQSLEIEAAVDTGAFYTTLPASLLRELGVTPEERVSYTRYMRRQPRRDSRFHGNDGVLRRIT